jgi:hypothetical protein
MTEMKMICKIAFDPLEVAPKEINEALATLASKIAVTFHNSRETEPKPKAKEGK